MGKKHPYYGKIMSTNFLGSPYTMGFVGFSRKSIFQAFPIRQVYGLASISHVLGNWQENPCISHMMKYTIGWDSNEKKHPYYGKSYDYQFPRFSTYNGFSRI